MRSLKISIIGSGWVGLSLARNLISLGHMVSVTTTKVEKQRKLREEGIECHLLDLCSPSFREDGSNKWETIFQADLLIVTVPPTFAESSDQEVLTTHQRICEEGRKNGIVRYILFGSTTVYPNLNRSVSEGDACHRRSKHSGADLLGIEKVYPIGNTVILRFGALQGLGKDPWRIIDRLGLVKNSEAPINVTFLEDIIEAVSFMLANEEISGAFNLVCPKFSTRCEFYTNLARRDGRQALDCDKQLSDWKRVDSSKIISLGYSFRGISDS